MQAYIAGTVSMSTVDYPGKISYVVFFAGCNFRCPFCYNSEHIDFKDIFLRSPREIKHEIFQDRDFLDAVVFSGGEPTLQRAPLFNLARYAKELGLKVGVETNGTRPEVLASLVREQLVDFVGMDIKSPLKKGNFEKATNSRTFFKSTEEIIESVKQSLKILKDNSEMITIEIRTTIVPGLVDSYEQLEKIGELVEDTAWRWKLQQFRPDLGKLADPKLEKLDAPSKKSLDKLAVRLRKRFPELQILVKVAG